MTSAFSAIAWSIARARASESPWPSASFCLMGMIVASGARPTKPVPLALRAAMMPATRAVADDVRRPALVAAALDRLAVVVLLGQVVGARPDVHGLRQLRVLDVHARVDDGDAHLPVALCHSARPG